MILMRLAPVLTTTQVHMVTVMKEVVPTHPPLLAVLTIHRTTESISAITLTIPEHSISSDVPTPSPAGGSSYQPSPSPSYAAPSPGIGYSPMAANVQSPYHLSSGRDHDILGSQDSYSPDIEVVIKDSHDDTLLCGQIGVVRGDHEQPVKKLSINSERLLDSLR